MPIDLRTHDPDDSVDIDPGTNKATIVQYLYRNPNLGFKPAEIHDVLDIPKGSVTTTLVRLFDEGSVGKTPDGYYHALESRDDLRRFVTGLVQVEGLTDRYDGLQPGDIEVSDDHPTARDDSATADLDDKLAELDEEFE